MNTLIKQLMEKYELCLWTDVYICNLVGVFVWLKKKNHVFVFSEWAKPDKNKD